MSSLPPQGVVAETSPQTVAPSAPGHAASAAADKSGHSQRACICVSYQQSKWVLQYAELCPSRCAAWLPPLMWHLLALAGVEPMPKLSDKHSFSSWILQVGIWWTSGKCFFCFDWACVSSGPSSWASSQFCFWASVAWWLWDGYYGARWRWAWKSPNSENSKRGRLDKLACFQSHRPNQIMWPTPKIM